VPDLLAGFAEEGAERSVAVRTLLGAPLLVAEADPDGFAAVARHRAWLTEWFEDTCGWALSVDLPGRFARLTKRSARPDPTRPARRSRGQKLAFDRRRYELLARLCAELATHQVTTIGILAGALAAGAAGGFDSSLQRERAAFVDALRQLGAWGVVRFEGGDIDGYVSDRDGNALVLVDSGRVHRLLAPAQAPCRIDAVTTAHAIDQLAAEPRYGSGEAGYDAGDDDRDDDGQGIEGEETDSGDRAGDERRRRRARHSLARRLLDDPAVHLDELDGEERAYLASSSGRRWIRERVGEAGLVLEERAEGLLGVDPDGMATDLRFPAPNSTVRQVALILVDQLVTGVAGSRSLVDRSTADLASTVARLLGDHPNWARDYQGEDGPARLALAAVQLLASLGLVVVDGPADDPSDRPAESTADAAVDGAVVRPRPALARYAVAPLEGALL
jgi:uncharacterized protein (TIGR02678 family)